jgi:hypothetical protein
MQELPPAPRGKLRLLSLEDLDGRTKAAFRARQLVGELMAHLGGEDRASVAEKQLATRAAIIGAICTDFETKWLKGEKMDLWPYLAATNNLRRLFQTLGLRPRQIDVTPDLRTYLRDRAADDA